MRCMLQYKEKDPTVKERQCPLLILSRFFQRENIPSLCSREDHNRKGRIPELNKRCGAGVESSEIKTRIEFCIERDIEKHKECCRVQLWSPREDAEAHRAACRKNRSDEK